MPRQLDLPFVTALILALSVCLPAPAAAAPALEVTGRAGARAFSVAQLRKLPATAGFGGVRSSTGKVALPGGWKGVALRDLVAAAEGYDAGKNLAVVAKDGYSLTFSYDQVMNGAFTAYDPGTGDTLASHEPLTAIIAYEHEGRPLTVAEDGPLSAKSFPLQLTGPDLKDEERLGGVARIVVGAPGAKPAR